MRKKPENGLSMNRSAELQFGAARCVPGQYRAEREFDAPISR